ncbi:MAG: hypothetical protein FVQ83_09540 [Chloroflexi bacterium]|nr:hypothetical protein [Chloroflexota bacterium]
MAELESIYTLLKSATSETPQFPPTDLFNEGWLLRLVIDWFSKHAIQENPFSFMESSHWFSEASLPSAFLRRTGGDNLAEAHTKADGVIGHITIGNGTKTELSLLPTASQFMVLEAKIFSKLSTGVTNAKYFDQAARNVACIAEVLKRAHRPPTKITRLGFYVLAPKIQIDTGVFDKNIARTSIREKVKKRVGEYKGEKDSWFQRWGEPTIERIELATLSWEKLFSTIRKYDQESAGAIEGFYKKCLEFN